MKTEVDQELNEDSQEVRLDDEMCALMCEQRRSITESARESQVTSEEMQCLVEHVRRLRMAMADVRKRVTSEDLQRVKRMEEGLKKLEEKTRIRQEEVRAKGTDEQEVTMKFEEEVRRKATREGRGCAGLAQGGMRRT